MKLKGTRDATEKTKAPSHIYFTFNHLEFLRGWSNITTTPKLTWPNTCLSQIYSLRGVNQSFNKLHFTLLFDCTFPKTILRDGSSALRNKFSVLLVVFNCNAHIRKIFLAGFATNILPTKFAYSCLRVSIPLKWWPIIINHKLKTKLIIAKIPFLGFFIDTG